MTIKEAIEELQHCIDCYPICEAPCDDALNIAIKALKFAQWVANEVIDEDLWELNHGAFAEIACRKLEKLGIVKLNDGYWEMSE